jgi:CBS domain-containing protein
MTMLEPTTKVDDLMTGRPIWISNAARAHEALVLAETEGVHYLLVADRDKDLAGITCLCELMRAGVNEYVESFAHSSPIFVMSGALAESAVSIMARCSVGCLPVIAEPGNVVGILTRHDLVKAGFIKLEPGVTQCASCGSTHNLKSENGGLKFCLDCLETTPDKGTLERKWYCTMGGGD